ncbi:hypothetical protein FHT40_006081 [Mycolicibacterium sp. BK556]|uniref:hypothetical protein n=1 Tax=unclassified Mycolicibacterium TaxID=2636767 RepID=UPI00160B3A22|nr:MULTISPECIES: hypothetical protein [unclassified Mycolicibacterium]MBB3606390.1 hypothetical protein [Mycolicibacterium sp. BK556]MBB3636364.1 hypothetical protein [Mycolicibacterium sp. BK607]
MLEWDSRVELGDASDLSIRAPVGTLHISPCSPADKPHVAIHLEWDSGTRPYSLDARRDHSALEIDLQQVEATVHDQVTVGIDCATSPSLNAIVIHVDSATLQIEDAPPLEFVGKSALVQLTARDPNGSTRMSLENGTVDLVYASSASLEYVLRTDVGIITYPDGTQTAVGTQEVRGSLGAGRAGIRVDLGNGRIDLAIN